jgi:hypothetical protein
MYDWYNLRIHPPLRNTEVTRSTLMTPTNLALTTNARLQGRSELKPSPLPSDSHGRGHERLSEKHCRNLLQHGKIKGMVRCRHGSEKALGQYSATGLLSPQQGRNSVQ